MDTELAAKREEYRQLQRDCRHLLTDIRLYEEGMRQTREDDETRHQRLEEWEQGLKARERKLYLDIQEFEKRQKRWQQLKDIT